LTATEAENKIVNLHIIHTTCSKSQ